MIILKLPDEIELGKLSDKYRELNGRIIKCGHDYRPILVKTGRTVFESKCPMCGETIGRDYANDLFKKYK